MELDRLRRSLNHLGVRPADYQILKLLPLIYVAWADGTMELVKEDRIHFFAATQLDLSPRGLEVLNQWLNERPSHAYISEALRDIHFLTNAPDDMGFDYSELPALLSYAEGIARSTAEALDQPDAVTPGQDRVLAEIAAELHVNHGESWGHLLRELSAQGPQKSSAARDSAARI